MFIILISLSDQKLVDCDKKNYGCEGGVKEEPFMFIEENKWYSQDEPKVFNT